jgi:tripartite-type tricarboxylate transporter receptor subunit TctC
MKIRGIASLLCAVSVASLAWSAEKQPRPSGGAFLLAEAGTDNAPDFSDKTLTILSGGEAGGSYDLYSRLFARHVGDHLPGRPRVVVQDMGAAGGLVAANYLYNIAPRDGTYLGVISQTAAIGQVVGVPGIRYDVRKFDWIGRLTANVQVLQTWHTSPAKTFADVLTHQVVTAGTGPTSSSVVFPKIMNDELGTKFKLVPGFSGMASAVLAMQRGEVDAVVRPWADLEAKNPDWITNHQINPIVQFAISRDPEIDDVPAIVDLAKTPAQRQLFALFASGNDIGNALVAPPGLPPQTLAALRAAYDATMKDPAFLADARQSKSEIDPLDGAALAKLNADAFDTPPAIVELAKTYSGIH